VEAYAGSDDPGSHSFHGLTARNAPMFGPPAHLYVYVIYGMHCCANVVTGAVGDPSAVLIRAGQVVKGLEVARARRPGVRDAELARGPACVCRALGIDRRHTGASLEAATAWTVGPFSGCKVSDPPGGPRWAGADEEQPADAKVSCKRSRSTALDPNMPGIKADDIAEGAWCAGTGSGVGAHCCRLLLKLPKRCVNDYATGPRVGLRLAADRPWRFWVPGEPSVSVYRPAAPLKRE
jgi:3-methyladenine DNA glycosylase Mpg